MYSYHKLLLYYDTNKAYLESLSFQDMTRSTCPFHLVRPSLPLQPILTFSDKTGQDSVPLVCSEVEGWELSSASGQARWPKPGLSCPFPWPHRPLEDNTVAKKWPFLNPRQFDITHCSYKLPLSPSKYSAILTFAAHVVRLHHCIESFHHPPHPESTVPAVSSATTLPLQYSLPCPYKYNSPSFHHK